MEENSAPALVLGVLGCGVVGGGLVSILSRYENAVKIKKVCVKDLNKDRSDINFPKGTELTTSYDSVLNDPEINCVVELIGGKELARECVYRAIGSGKHVVTANKALISKFLDELQKLLDEQKGKVAFYYEAAVCGGIPIVNAFHRGMAGDRISKIVGIMNGTTNYILCKMVADGISCEEALKLAQYEGYAEADSTADIMGWDTRSKLCILAKLAFGLTIDEDSILCEGIQKLRQIDFAYAKMLKRTIKLLGICEIVQEPDGSPAVQLSTSPVLVLDDSTLGQTNGVTNIVEVTSENLLTTSYCGPGAGRMPSANSAVADVLDLASRVKKGGRDSQSASYPEAFPSSRKISNVNLNFTSDFYVRFVVRDRCGVIRAISAAFEKYSISIFSILQLPIEDPDKVPFVVLTQAVRINQIELLVKELKLERSTLFDFLVEDPMYIRCI